jgi:hypothetical protein
MRLRFDQCKKFSRFLAADVTVDGVNCLSNLFYHFMAKIAMLYT